jgi:hypothetical protein
MRNKKSGFIHTSLILTLSLAMIGLFPFAGAAVPQTGGTIDAGTTIQVRTNEQINTDTADGRVYTGVVDKDVMGSNSRLVIPKGSNVELIARKTSNNELALDMDSITVNGRRYSVAVDENVQANKEGLGVNQRTGKYVGGGAALGAIIGAIAGGGKGAAIGAGAGAAAGAGVQVLTRGKNIEVPAESLLTYRLSQPLRAGFADTGYYRNGTHYHSTYNDNQAANRFKPGYSNGTRAYSNGTGTISIRRDNNIAWSGPIGSSVYVQMDNQAPKLFASGQSGTQAAPWITQGHLYTFTLRDSTDTDIASDTLDTR